MPRNPIRAAYLEARESEGRTRGQAVYQWRIERLMQEGFPRSVARGHSPIPVRVLREVRQEHEEYRRRNPDVMRPPMPARESAFEEFEFREMTKRQQEAVLMALYPDPNLSMRYRYAAFYGSP